MFRPRRDVAAPAATVAALLVLCCASASAQTASQAFGTLTAPAGEWLPTARAGYAFQHGAAADTGATDAAAVRASGPMSGGGMGGGPMSGAGMSGGTRAAIAGTDAPRATDQGPWTAWSSSSPLGLNSSTLGQFGVGSISPFGMGFAQAMAFGQGTVTSGGMSYQVQPGVSVNFGYQQIDLGRSDFTAGTTLGALTATRLQSASAAVNLRATSNTTLSFGVGGSWVGDSTGSQRNSAWDNGGDALNAASIVAPQR